MPFPNRTLLIEGTIEELADELAIYIDDLRQKQNVEGAIQPEVNSLLQEKKAEDALKKLVGASSILNSAPEKEIISAYNLLIYIVRQAPSPGMFLSRICTYLSKPISSSPANGAGLALAVLSTVFNTVAPDDDSRFHIFMTILSVIKASTNFETLKPQLKNLDTWMDDWELDEDDQRRLYLELSEAAQSAGEAVTCYEYLLRALRTIPADDIAGDEARKLSLRALKAALNHPTHFDFQDLTSLDTIQALREPEPQFYQLLEIFTSDTLEELNDFKDENEGWLEKQGLDKDALNRKMRLLTLTTLAAHASSTRSLPYANIAKALMVPIEEVELWVIDVIRAGLVEGKLSQLNQQFLIHRSTYRVFGDNQWREVSSRLEMWRTSLQNVLQVIRQEKENFEQQRGNEERAIESKMNGMGDVDRRGGGGFKQRQQRAVEVDE
ncbi:eukaryotic translation initiation factor 3 subunit M [Venturia nashicola]|uniref:Eukaryotic translation initiation factor 3 subunit M n=1 Tax=Venturia nashicola TaxID=86259 RepID=A0A4Z1PNQ9_9PEZI|nr:eukaryotic translation initiation factor 3 subunit M [Venturia nashicola]